MPPSTQPPQSGPTRPAEEMRRRSLRRMKTLATGLLLVAAVTYVVAFTS